MMIRQLLTRIAGAGLFCCVTATIAQAQYTIQPPIGGPPPPAYHGGYYGFGDPSFAVTPFGLQSIGQYGFGGYNPFMYLGYDPYTNTVQQMNSGYDVMSTIYSQGYRDAVAAAAATAAREARAAAEAAAEEARSTVDASTTTDMTATPRAAIARVPHGTDTVRAWRPSKGRIALRWLGDPRVASSVTFSISDKYARPLLRTTVTELPAEAHFTPPANAAFYQVVVHYVDGATNTIMSRLYQSASIGTE